jgi:hypothetical protein
MHELSYSRSQPIAANIFRSAAKSLRVGPLVGSALP